MEFYSYLNIFETKGLEYLLLISFLVLFLLLIKYLSVPGKQDSVSGEKSSTTADLEAAVVKVANRKPG